MRAVCCYWFVYAFSFIVIPFFDTLVYPGSGCSAAGIVCGGGSNCQDGLCKCPENLVIGQGGAACVTSNKPVSGNTAAPLEPCTPSFTICQGDSICSPIHNHCVCAQNKVAQYGQCVAQPTSRAFFTLVSIFTLQYLQSALALSAILIVSVRMSAHCNAAAAHNAIRQLATVLVSMEQ